MQICSAAGYLEPPSRIRIEYYKLPFTIPTNHIYFVFEFLVTFMGIWCVVHKSGGKINRKPSGFDKARNLTSVWFNHFESGFKHFWIITKTQSIIIFIDSKDLNLHVFCQ